MKPLALSFILILLISCNGNSDTNNRKNAVTDVLEAEENFKNLCQSKGIQEGFYAFADENATLKRDNDSLIKGRENIKNYYSNPKYKNASVTWEPDYVNASEDGTMAYTYGKYIWTVTDSIGNKKELKGVFHTVWQKQKDGSWKYVWD